MCVYIYIYIYISLKFFPVTEDLLVVLDASPCNILNHKVWLKRKLSYPGTRVAHIGTPQCNCRSKKV